MRKQILADVSDFYCTQCGNKGIPILRKKGKEKEPGHLKKLYCLCCKDDVNMAEVKYNGKYSLEDFLIEFKGGNFINGNRIMPYKQFIAEYKNQKKEE